MGNNNEQEQNDMNLNKREVSRDIDMRTKHNLAPAQDWTYTVAVVVLILILGCCIPDIFVLQASDKPIDSLIQLTIIVIQALTQILTYTGRNF
jgi:hypothetical protein